VRRAGSTLTSDNRPRPASGYAGAAGAAGVAPGHPGTGGRALRKETTLVGYSLGGWIVLAHGNRMPDLVAAAVAYYPSTMRAGEPKAFLADPPATVPTLMLAGVKDTYMGCCTIERARALAAAAALPGVGASLRLVEYPEADHGFVLPAYPQVYRPDDAADALRQALEHLRRGGF